MIDIAFIFFRTLRLEHLDAAWLTLSRQDFTDVGRVIFIDNNTDYSPMEIEAVLDRHPLPVPRILSYQKHGDHYKTQSWSCNLAGRTATNDWLFLTRADFLLNDDTLARFRALRDEHAPDWRGFVTSYCHQMAYDNQLSNTDDLAPHSFPDAAWRTDGIGPSGLVGTVPGVYFHETHIDAGVWLIRRSLMHEAGGLNERMTSWGYQQQVFQRRLRDNLCVDIQVIPEYLFHHQHHAAPRDVSRANAEMSY
jgi:hypothetical protein